MIDVTYNQAVVNMITTLGTGRNIEMVIYQDYESGNYSVFKSGETEEELYLLDNKQTEVVLRMDYFKAKLFIHEVKILDRKVNEYGANKEDYTRRELTGRDVKRLDAGAAGDETGKLGDSAELSGANDNDHAGNSASDSGDQTGPENIAKSSREITMDEAEKIIKENRLLPGWQKE